MNGNNEAVVRREWMNAVVDIIRFFFQHSTVEFDGPERKARVRYFGPKGWNVSVETTLDRNARLGEGMEARETWSD